MLIPDFTRERSLVGAGFRVDIVVVDVGVVVKEVRVPALRQKLQFRQSSEGPRQELSLRIERASLVQGELPSPEGFAATQQVWYFGVPGS